MCEKHYTSTVKNEERNSLKKQMGGQGDNNIKQQNRQQNAWGGGRGEEKPTILEGIKIGKHENILK